jgi:putative tryptophan/tyrosine transport system substrate-binding protein
MRHRGSKPRPPPRWPEKLGFEPRLLELIGEPPDYAAALKPMDRWPSEPIMIPASPLTLRDRATIARLLLERRTPSISEAREVMEAGALISYGINLVDVFRDIAAFVDHVARLGKAGDVPMRAPSHFHTAFNLKTAKTLGLSLPPTLLARAASGHVAAAPPSSVMNLRRFTRSPRRRARAVSAAPLG